MNDDTILIHCTWDSGPYGVYYESPDGIKIDHPNGYGSNTVPIPRDVWKRYENACGELHAAEEALGEAEQKALDELRAKDNRWIAHEAAAAREP